MARSKPENPAPYFRPGRRQEGPVFMPDMLTLPTRDRMQTAIWSAIDAIVFKVRYLSDGDLTCVPQDGGGLQANAFPICMALRAGADLAAMYEALSPDKRPEEEEAEAVEEPGATS